jgi:hypothetical protein
VPYGAAQQKGQIMKNWDVNWYAVGSAAFTAIRVEFPVSLLQAMAASGNETPVSGDALAEAKAL